jgi:hypothetical protein
VRAPARGLVALGAIAPPAFVALFLVEGATRPGYDPWSQPVSALALGKRGPRQRASFLVTGSAVVLAGVGLGRVGPASRWGSRLISGAGVGLIGAGLADTDPLRGYDPEDRPGITVEGLVHQAASVPVFVGLPAAAAAYGRRFAADGERGWAAASFATAVWMLVGAAAFGAAFGEANHTATPSALGRRGGLAQRVTIVLGWGWLTALSIRVARRGR